MQAAPPAWLPDARRKPAALIREARKRQRRRWLTGGAALLMIAAGTATVIANSVASGRPGLPRPAVTVRAKPAPSVMAGVPTPADTSVRLLLNGPQPAWFSLATGRVEPISGLPWDRWGYLLTRVVGGWSAQPATAGPACGATCPGPPVPNYFIADGSQRAARIARGYEVTASDSRDAVWLITFQQSGADITTTPALAQEITTGGWPLSAKYRLPAGYLVQRAVGGDLLLAPVNEGPGTVTYRLWDPLTRRLARTFSDVIAAGPQEIAWGPICVHCPVHVRGLTGTTATISLPDGTWASNDGTFSADGQYLAFPLWAGTAPDGEPALTRIAVIDLATRHLLVVPGSAVSWDVTKGVLNLGWQPSGHILVAVLPGAGDTIQVASWQPGEAQLWVATTRVPPQTSVVLGEYG